VARLEAGNVPWLQSYGKNWQAQPPLEMTLMDGYLLVASNYPKYFELATSAARSIRFFDTEREICLACDDENRLPPESRDLFDHVVILPNTADLKGTEHHLYLDRVTPFQRTLYVDADCLLANRRIHEVWKKLEEYHVTFPGRKLTRGNWRVDIPQLLEKMQIEYVVQLNGGVFYFDRSPESQAFFRTAQALFETQRDEITVKHGSGDGYANEPIWGVTMAMRKTPIFPLSQHLNVSTLRAERWAIDSEPYIQLWKDKRKWTPVFCHFLGLGGDKCPNDLYHTFRSLLKLRADSVER
jgi:hypothetical protein